MIPSVRDRQCRSVLIGCHIQPIVSILSHDDVGLLIAAQSAMRDARSRAGSAQAFFFTAPGSKALLETVAPTIESAKQDGQKTAVVYSVGFLPVKD